MLSGKNKIRYLVVLSLSQGKLDPKKIGLIAKTLSKRELRAYYKMLVKVREDEKVHVSTAIDVSDDIVERIMKLFPNKEVSFSKDPSIIAGLTVKVVDFVFDASLKGYLTEIKKQYQN